MLKLIFALVVWSLGTLAAEIPIRLQYLPNVPVEQISKLHVSFNDAFPGLKFEGEADQTISSIITLHSEQQDLPFYQPPLDLIFTLKHINLSINANGARIDYNAENSQFSSIPLAQGYKLLNKPIKLHINENFAVDSEQQEFKKIIEHVPILQEIHLENFLTEWFQNIFALSGKDLAVGKTYEITSNQIGSKPSLFKYTITSITEQEIECEFKGDSEGKNIKLTHPISFDGVKLTSLELNLSGKIKGTIKWGRLNALVCRIDSNHIFTGSLKTGQNSWNLGFTLNHTLESKPF